MTFKEKIVILRKTKGLTQDEFAKAVGVSRQAVYKWESGQSYPEVAKLLEIKALFAISIDDLLDDSFEVALPEKKKRRRAPKAVEAAPAVEVEAAPVAEEAPAVEEAPAAEVEAAPAVEQTPAPEAEEKAEKRGFFSRLFSRR